LSFLQETGNMRIKIKKKALYILVFMY